MTSAEPSLTLAVGSLILGLAASLLWTVTRFLIVAAHHGSQALLFSAGGRRIKHIEMRPGRSEIVVEGDASFFALLGGFLGPSLFGLLGATMLAHRLSPETVLWTAFILLAIVFFQTKNPFGLVITAIYGTLLFVLARNGSAGVRALSAYSLVWFLLLGSVIHTVLYSVAGKDAATCVRQP